MWLWLEQRGYCDNLVSKLLTWPNFMINRIAGETLTFLYGIDDDKLMPALSSDAIVIPLLTILTKDAIYLRFFQKERIAVIEGVLLQTLIFPMVEKRGEEERTVERKSLCFCILFLVSSQCIYIVKQHGKYRLIN